VTDDKIIRQLFPEISEIRDKILADRVVATWVRAWGRAEIRNPLIEFPFFHQAPSESLIGHVRKVTRFALALARSLSEDKNAPSCDQDILLAACLLHDVDKLLLYKPSEDGTGWEPSPISHKFAHGLLGAMLCNEEGLPEIVVHLVATHSLDSPLAPEPYEGVILHYADYFAADTTLWQTGLPLLLKH